MKYISTRGDKADSFKDVLFAGLAKDGGLFIPESWPQIELSKINSNISYVDLTHKIISLYIGNEISDNDLEKIIIQAYKKSFSKEDLVSFKELNNNEVIVELFNGPTLAFKDFAMQLLIPIFDYFLSRENRKINLIVATSGDTGSAAINAVKNSKYISIFCLYPKGRISEFQRRQMSTVTQDNINLCEIDGTFDDCQKIVKSILRDEYFCNKFSISAVNSINWARIVIQSVYYFFTFLRFHSNDEINKINYIVPTGNFGDIYAGYVAYKMGLPINKLLIATNENDILDRFLHNGKYQIGEVFKTTSPSMDIQIASNFERLLFDLLDGSSERTKEKMLNLENKGTITVNDEQLKLAKTVFCSERSTVEHVNATISQVFNENKYLIDPHTAVGLYASRVYNDQSHKNYILSTAHPAKFSDTVEKAIGKDLNLLKRYNSLFLSDEKFLKFGCNVDEIKNQIINMNS